MRYRTLVSIFLFVLGLLMIPLYAISTNPYLLAAWGLLMLTALYIRKRTGKKARVFVNPNDRDDYFVDPHTL